MSIGKTIGVDRDNDRVRSMQIHKTKLNGAKIHGTLIIDFCAWWFIVLPKNIWLFWMTIKRIGCNVIKIKYNY